MFSRGEAWYKVVTRTNSYFSATLESVLPKPPDLCNEICTRVMIPILVRIDPSFLAGDTRTISGHVAIALSQRKRNVQGTDFVPIRSPPIPFLRRVSTGHDGAVDSVILKQHFNCTNAMRIVDIPEHIEMD